MNKIEKLAGEYNSTFARLAVIESELTEECQKYVSWDTVDHVNEYGSMSESAYGHLAWYSI